MKSLTIFTLLFIFFTLNQKLNAQSGWYWQNPLPQGNFLKDLCFVDSIYGWAVGYKGVIMKTDDGGNNWQVISTGLDKLLSRVSFIDKDKGWILSYYESIIYQTTNGGDSWDSLACLESVLYGDSDLKFINDTLGFACGNKIMRTTDGGSSWQETPIPLSQPFIKFNTLYFLDDKSGWVAGEGSHVLKTSDGGNTWNAISLPIIPDPEGFFAYKIYFLNRYWGFIAGIENDCGILLMSDDGGISWERGLFANSLFDVYFTSPDTGWVRDGRGNIYYTVDQGYNWKLMTSSCYDFHFLNNRYAWGIFSLNLIKRTTDGWNSNELQTPSITSRILWSISVHDSQNVIACGQNETIVGTKNGGMSWSIYFSSDSIKNLYDILYKNRDEIWSVGEKGCIIYSRDSGSTWDETKLSDFHLQSIDFVNDTIGFIMTNNSIYKTIDNGITWNLDTIFTNISHVNKIRFSNSSIGWISTEKGVLRSTNFGDTWEFAYSSNSFFEDIAAIENHAWITHGNWILFTTDSGNSWNDVKVYDLHPTVPRFIESVSFSDTLNGWVALQGGKIYKTTDGGFNWNLEDQVSGISLYSIKFSDSENGWAVGCGGAILYYGEKLTYINIGSSHAFPQLYYLYENYPNPFNSSTTISYKIPVAEEIELSLFNLLGQKITVLYSGMQTPGIHKLQLNGKDLSSGIYIYQLKSKNYSTSRKCILIK